MRDSKKKKEKETFEKNEKPIGKAKVVQPEEQKKKKNNIFFILFVYGCIYCWICRVLDRIFEICD